jgi:zinc transport system ATP-binding protein
MPRPILPAGAAVTFENVTVTLGGITILEEVNARVPLGTSTAVVGPNGAGKTTLLLALLGEVPYKGQIHLTGPLKKLNPRIGYVPQRLAFDRGMPLTVSEFLIMGMQRAPLWLGTRPGHRDRAGALLAAVRGEHLKSRAMGALSSGEIQRVLLALALGQEPDLLVLDEPAAGVDLHGEQLFCELLETLQKERAFTQLMVSHDLATVTHHAGHVICLNRRVAAEGPPAEVLTRKNLMLVYGLHMGFVDSNVMAEEEVNPVKTRCRETGHD